MTRTGKFVSDFDNTRLKKIYLRAQESLFGATDQQLNNTLQRVSNATAEFYAEVDKAAVAFGLPEPETNKDGEVIHYGLDFQNCEILAV